jgi:peptidoglycan hydrolase-like protein with peptidoglycan-binding domain
MARRPRKSFRYRMQVGDGPVEDFDCQRRNPMTFKPSSFSGTYADIALYNPATLSQKRGSKGGDVETLHELLANWKYGRSSDAYQEKLFGSERAQGIMAQAEFGPKTHAEVRNFQKVKGLGVDGVVGSNTWSALEGKEAPAKKKKVLDIFGGSAPSTPENQLVVDDGKDDGLKKPLYEEPWFIPVAVGVGFLTLGTFFIALKG